MRFKRQALSRVLYVIGIISITVWGLMPLFGPWVPVEATVFGRDHEVYVSYEEDEPNEYYAVLNICYEFNDELWSDSLYLSRDGPTGWRLQDSKQAVEEARRHSVGETRPILVHAKDPANWVVSTPRIWPYVLMVMVFGSFTLLLAWELPALQAGFLAFALVIGYLSNRAGTAGVLPRELDPRPLVALCQTPRAFERVPLSGPKRPDSLEHALSQWGRPDALWLEAEDGLELAYLIFREGDFWEYTWTLTFQKKDGKFSPLGPPDRRTK